MVRNWIAFLVSSMFLHGAAVKVRELSSSVRNLLLVFKVRPIAVTVLPRLNNDVGLPDLARMCWPVLF